MADLAAASPLEEQTLLRFDEKRYFPVKLGQVLADRYEILSKLGYGACSTVWLVRDSFLVSQDIRAAT